MGKEGGERPEEKGKAKGIRTWKSGKRHLEKERRRFRERKSEDDLRKKKDERFEEIRGDFGKRGLGKKDLGKEGERLVE